MSKKKNDYKTIEHGVKVSPGKYKNVGIKKTDGGAKRPPSPKPSSTKEK